MFRSQNEVLVLKGRTARGYQGKACSCPLICAEHSFHEAFGLLVSTLIENPLSCPRMIEVNITIMKCIVSLLAVPKYGF